MGQATVDLPDPLNSPAPSTSAGTDDLLAQLAGEEIDRLLADADVGSPPATEPATPNVPADDTPALNASNSEPIAASTQLPQKDSDPELAAALGNLLDGLDEKLATSPAPPGTADAVSPATEAPWFSHPVDESPDESGTSTSERDALNHPTTASDAMVALDDEAAASDRDDDSIPIYLKPLEWLSAPLANAPESVRETIGKIAILTLVNAFAILIYVLFIRRH